MRIGILFMGNESDRLWGGGVISFYLCRELERLGHCVWRVSINDIRGWSDCISRRSDAIICHGVPASRVDRSLWESADQVLFWWLSDMFYSAKELAGSPFTAVAGNSSKGITALQLASKPAAVIELAADESFLDLSRNVGEDLSIVYLGVYPHKSERQMRMLFNPARHFQFEIWGRGWDRSPYSDWYRGVLPLMDVGYLYSRAKIVLLLTEERQQLLGMINNRLFEALAAGAAVVSENFPYLRTHELGRYVEFVSSEAEALLAFNRIFANCHVSAARENECRSIIRLCHTYRRVAKQFIQLIEDTRNNNATVGGIHPVAAREPMFSSEIAVPFLADRIAITVGAGDGVVASYDKWWGLDMIRCQTSDDDWRSSSVSVRLPTGSASPTVSARFGGPRGGCQALVAFRRGAVLRCRLRFWVHFDSRFDFVKGGKLPGFYGGVGWSGGAQSVSKDSGFSTRLMWRSGGQGEIYAYLPSRGKFGESLFDQPWWFNRGKRTHIDQVLKLNDIGKANGTLRLKVDGVTVYNSSDLILRNREEVRLEGVVLAVFFGGSDLSWVASKDEEVSFGGFMIDFEWENDPEAE